MDSLEKEGNENFNFSEFVLNPTGWGPGPENKFELREYEGLPFVYFNKNDRIGRIVDWVSADKKKENRGAQYADDDDDDFQLVVKIQAPKQQFRNFRRGNLRKPMQRQPDRQEVQNARLKRVIEKEHNRAKKMWVSRGGGTRGFDQGRRRYDDHQAQDRTASVQVRSSWKLLEELDYQRLSKLSLPNVAPGQDIDGEVYGTLRFYDKKFDMVSGKNSIPLEKFHGMLYNLTTTEDPVLMKLTKLKKDKSKRTVFATDIILATLMTATRSVNSWDILVTKMGNKLLFDKRDIDGTSNAIDALAVSETATNPPSFTREGINNAKDLALEALYINQNFRRQVLLSHGKSYKCVNERAPFEVENDAGAKADCSYRYRTWSLGTTEDGTVIELVARAENDAVLLSSNNQVQKISIKAFNEWDSSLSGGIDWRNKMDVQKGAVLATEMKNNSCKLAKWTLQAILGSSDYLKLGFVSRESRTSNIKHEILGVQQVKPNEFASSIGINLDNCWGIVRTLVDFFFNQPNGEYLLVKDPVEQVVRIYSTPEEEEEEEDEDESGSNASSETDAD